ncbi:MAG TPA: polyamine aminopropyltransferase [Chloroflexi bacterium]|nr:polyamine aminopropyltransferase [Chloroflexota bacterium]
MRITPFQTRTLFVSVFIIAICGLIYELIVGALSSYLWGNSVTHFSITIGLFMSAMGVGAFASKRVKGKLLSAFILVEIGTGIVGGLSAALLYAVFATSDYYYVAMVSLILIIGAFIGMEIPLLTRLVGEHQSLKDASANVLAFDYIGALFASILFPIVLLPQLGLLQTSFAMGLLNLTVVWMNLWVFRDHLKDAWELAGLSVLASIILLSGLLWSGQITSYFERRLYRDKIIYAQQTPYQRIILTRWKDDVRLFLDGNLQFSAQDEYRYHEMLVHPAMTFSRSRESILILGGGDGLVIREVLKYPDVQRITLVDIDPAITKLSRAHPAISALNQNSLDDPRVTLAHQDAYKFLEESSEQFGVIIIDLPDPNNESLGKLYSNSFYTLAQRHLAVGGVMVSQATSPYFARDAYWCIVHTAGSVGWHIVPYHTYVPSFGDWGFFLASQHRLKLDDFEAIVPTRYLTPEIFSAGRFFDSDSDEVETEINTLDSQILMRYYEKGWQQWR